REIKHGRGAIVRDRACQKHRILTKRKSKGQCRFFPAKPRAIFLRKKRNRLTASMCARCGGARVGAPHHMLASVDRSTRAYNAAWYPSSHDRASTESRVSPRHYSTNALQRSVVI